MVLRNNRTSFHTHAKQLKTHFFLLLCINLRQELWELACRLFLVGRFVLKVTSYHAEQRGEIVLFFFSFFIHTRLVLVHQFPTIYAPGADCLDHIATSGKRTLKRTNYKTFPRCFLCGISRPKWTRDCKECTF